VGIARALAAEPQLILADEPTSMLDVSIRLDIMNLLLDLRERDGLSFLFITHDLAGARYMCDRIAVMYAGHLVELGPAARVIDAPLHPYTRLLRSAAPKPELGLAPERVEARGEVPDLASLPPGCPFEPRCPHARPECRAGVPPLVTPEPGHQARCVLHAQEGAPGSATAPP
jgi:peptide/nickel transport system ATP-binding protein